MGKVIEFYVPMNFRTPLEKGTASMRKGYRDLHADKEIRLAVKSVIWLRLKQT